MGTLSREDKSLILGMLEHNVERELKDIEARIARIREYVARAVRTVYKSIEQKDMSQSK